MAGSTQIGSGSVVLTANADKLLSGLGKASAATDRWASNTSKKVGKVFDANEKAYRSRLAAGEKLAGYMGDVDYSKRIKGGRGGGGGLLGGLVGGLSAAWLLVLLTAVSASAVRWLWAH